MKFARYSSIASAIPVHATSLKHRCRFPLRVVRRNFTKPRRISAYTQKHQLCTKAVMVAQEYLPPWFRWVLGNMQFFILFFSTSSC